MQKKKNSKKDIRRWSLIFFQVGLIVALFISWRAIENKTYKKKEKVETVQVMNFSDLQPEDVKVVEQPQTNTPPPPPPPPKVPDKIEIVENDKQVEETEIRTVENIDQPKVEVSAAEYSDIQSVPSEPVAPEPVATVAFRAIQDVPIFPGCGQYTDNAKRKDCMSEKIRRFVNKRFDTELGRELGLSGITRINVQFTVDEYGKVVDVKARATAKPLEKEAKRVVNLLPDMKPGKQRGKAVRVVYTLPIVFKVN